MMQGLRQIIGGSAYSGNAHIGGATAFGSWCHLDVRDYVNKKERREIIITPVQQRKHPTQI